MRAPWSWRRVGKILVFVSLAFAAFALLERHKIARLAFAQNLFSGANQVEAFRRFPELFPGHLVQRAQQPYQLVAGPAFTLPKFFDNAGFMQNSAGFLSSTDTTGLLVVKDDRVVYEHYWLGNSAATLWPAWSVSKSFTSALIGIAVQSGAIASIEEPLTRYLPELRGSAYDGVRIKDALQMSSGARWSEDYGDYNSDINRFGRSFALGGSLDAFVATLPRQLPPGTFNRYNTMDAQVLGMLLRRVSGRSQAQYLQEQLWWPLGMENDAYWIADDAGAEFAAGGLCASLRDFAKLGQLYLHQGNWNGVQILPASWVSASVTPDAAYLVPGKRDSSDSSWGYGYLWWLPDASGAFAAVGIYNQFIYVNPSQHLVIAKTSANHRYGHPDNAANDREDEHIAFFQTLAKALAGDPATMGADGAPRGTP
jgi:CubicO group peptidase (beta-lactamase class C family)